MPKENQGQFDRPELFTTIPNYWHTKGQNLMNISASFPNKTKTVLHFEVPRFTDVSKRVLDF
jgi:hypothetical protein